MKKKLVVIVVLLFLVAGIIAAYFLIQKNKEDERKRKNEALLTEIKSHYNSYVVTNKDSKIYILDNDEYKEYGSISKDNKLYINPIDITTDTKYFEIKDLNFYISYEDVDKIDEFTYSDRYKFYIPFNVNIKTKNITNFYDEDNNLVYKINKSYDFAIIVNDTDRYGVIFNNQLLYVNKDDVEESYSNHNTDLVNKSKVRTLTYHFLYDPDDPNEEKCDQSICLTIYQLEEQAKYLRENDYFTMTLPELEMYMDGKIQIPQKSIVLTIDDGTFINQKAIAVFEKYQVNAAIFLITSWVKPDQFKSEYIELESHTHNMHNQYECPGYGYQGGGLLCLPEEKIKEDLKTSQDILGGSKYIAYPFFDVNEYAVRMLKESGFTMAFIGEWDSKGYSTPGVTDKFRMRRLTVFSDITLNEFINDYLN